MSKISSFAPICFLSEKVFSNQMATVCRERYRKFILKRNLENLVSQIKDPVSEIDDIHFIKESNVLYRRVPVSQVSVRSQVSAVSFRRHCESRSVTLSHKVPPHLQESHSWKSRQHLAGLA